MTGLTDTDTQYICCSECSFYREAPESGPEREGVCLLRSIDILFASWTVCASYRARCSSGPEAAPVQPEGPEYVDAGAFPDHLQAVYDWDRWLERERRRL